MLRRFTSGLLTAVLFGTLLSGAALARGAGGECRMSGMNRAHACCKRARTKRRATEVAGVMPCCLVKLPLPAPARTNFSFNASADANTSPRPAAVAAAPSLRPDTHARLYAPPFRPSHSPPAYIQHSAFLI